MGEIFTRFGRAAIVIVGSLIGCGIIGMVCMAVNS
jgi:hypothetical protein